MLWPVVLPFQITSVLFIAAILLLTALAPQFRWKRSKTFEIAMVVGFLAFIPSCMGIMEIIDRQRFGLFRYHDFAEVQDFRVERFLPPAASNVIIRKSFMGHRAHYSITEAELKKYIDQLWKESGRSHSKDHDDAMFERTIEASEYLVNFPDGDWPVPSESIELRGPVEENGRGAKYYYDRATGTASHRGAYW